MALSSILVVAVLSWRWFGGRGLVSSTSLPLGTVRLTERFFRNDPPSKSDLKALDKYLDAALDQVGWFTVQGMMQLVGVGGTVRNLAKIDQRLMRYPVDKYHGYHIPLERVEDWAVRLSKMTRAERDRVEGLNSDRADVMVAGLLLIRKLMRRAGALQISVANKRKFVINGGVEPTRKCS